MAKLAKLAGNTQLAVTIEQTPLDQLLQWPLLLVRAVALKQLFDLFLTVRMWASRVHTGVAFRLPILSTLLALVPKKWQRVLLDMDLPIVKAFRATIAPMNKSGVFWAEVHRKYGGLPSLGLLSWLKHLRCVKYANAHRPSKTVPPLLATMAVWYYLETRSQGLTVKTTERAVAVTEKLTSHLRSHALFTSRTPETAQMLKQTANAWLARNEEALEGMTHGELEAILVTAVSQSMIPSQTEQMGLNSMLKASPLLRRFFNVNTKGYPSALGWLTGMTMPKR